MHYSKETSIGVFPQKKKGMITIKIWLFVFMLCAIISMGISTVHVYTSTIPYLESEYDDEISNRDKEIERLKLIVGELENADLEGFSKAMAEHNPILVNDVEVCDESTYYGEDIQAENSTYLTVRVWVASFIKGHYDLYYKLYDPSGRLRHYAKDVDAYVEDYTAMESIYLNPYGFQDITFPSIGYNNKGHWSSGTYKIEIYFRGRCIGTKEFEIY